jgi:hypothetical protein
MHFRRRDMIKLKTQDLLKVYKKAFEMNLERDFIEILESELLRRGVINLSENPCEEVKELILD